MASKGSQADVCAQVSQVLPCGLQREPLLDLYLSTEGHQDTMLGGNGFQQEPMGLIVCSKVIHEIPAYDSET